MRARAEKRRRNGAGGNEFNAQDEVNASEANLWEANVWEANLWEVNVWEANLWEANPFADGFRRRLNLQSTLRPAAAHESPKMASEPDSSQNRPLVRFSRGRNGVRWCFAAARPPCSLPQIFPRASLWR
jgi:hypothetical protein